MTKYNQNFGNAGEQLAAEYLQAKNYKIAATNWRYGRAEVDIIAWTAADILVFIEVKTRKTRAFGGADEAVSIKKQNLLYEAAAEYMHLINYELEIRFDIIAVYLYEHKTTEIEHFEDAFFPSW